MARATFAARRLLEINGEYQRRIEAGYPLTLEGVEETLQLARDVDRTNWLIVQGIALRAIAAGQGDGLSFVQTTSNVRYVVTYTEQVAIIDALTAWGFAAWENWNRLKNLARDAGSDDALRAIDLSEGWP